MKIQTTLVLTLALAMMAMIPTVTAQTVEVGLSGQCYNEDASEGGQDELRVSDEEIVILSVTGAVDALVMFALGTSEDLDTGSACDRYDCYNANECNGRPLRSDYLEAHVTVLGTTVQVCYDGTAGVFTQAECPTSPTGPGQDA